MVTTFYIRLLSREYDENTGWHCGALALPSARVRKLIVGGTERSASDFVIEGSYIRLTGHPTGSSVVDSAVLVDIERRLVRIDTAIVVAIIGMLGTLGAGWLAHGNRQALECPETPCPALVCPSVVVQDGPSQGAPSTPVKPKPGKTPSLFQAFQAGHPQPFAGQGTPHSPTCHPSGDGLVVTIPAGYSEFAGCYVDVATPMDLSAFQNGVIHIELTKPTKQLEIKLEVGSHGDDRQETYLVQKPATAGPHVYDVKDVPPEIMKHARRLTFAIRSDSGESNTLRIRP
jgi:hypothetical protein